jgi:exonuclease VII large subunit
VAEDRQASGSSRFVVEGVARLERHIETGITCAFPSLFWVEGEVAELRAGQDWLRFLLVQPVDDDLVAVHAFLGRPHIDTIRERVGDNLRRVIAPGNTVQVAGRLHYASTSREVELRVERLSSAFRDGLLAQRRREVEAKLKLHGLYDRQRIQLRLPLTPLRVGIVSSTRGHGYNDAVQVLA